MYQIDTTLDFVRQVSYTVFIGTVTLTEGKRMKSLNLRKMRKAINRTTAAHTQGTWTLETDGSLVIGGQVVGSAPAPDSASKEEVKANAVRIVNCVNACEGINPEAVPDMLGALETALEFVDSGGLGTEINAHAKATLEKYLSNAIAKARGEA
jgi:hypothetical protein